MNLLQVHEICSRDSQFGTHRPEGQSEKPCPIFPPFSSNAAAYPFPGTFFITLFVLRKFTLGRDLFWAFCGTAEAAPF
jgi:hypothetical protein